MSYTSNYADSEMRKAVSGGKGTKAGSKKARRVGGKTSKTTPYGRAKAMDKKREKKQQEEKKKRMDYSKPKKGMFLD